VKTPRLDPREQRRLVALEEDGTVKAVAEALDEDGYYASVEGSATLIEYSCRHLRVSLDQAGRRGGG
jgi:hypothetical protein